jgi:DNA-binding winged helix-turn-helix (wHTH) protein
VPEPASHIFFAPFRLDLAAGRLWSGATEVAIRPKAFAVLRYLAENAGRLTTTGDLARAVWAGSHGSEALIKGCVRELRRILGDDALAPRYIETVGRRGYRFVAPTELSPGAPVPPAAEDGARSAFVGRDR